MGFRMMASSIKGMTKATNMRGQPIASVLSGVMVGTFAGLACGLDVGVAGETAVVAVTVGVAVLPCECAGVLGVAVKAKMTWARTPRSTSVVANCKGFSESAGVTRYQCPSHMAVMTPPRASAPAKKLPTIKTPARPEEGSGR